MNPKKPDERTQLLNIAEFMAEEIPASTDEEVLDALAADGIGPSDALQIAREARSSATKEVGALRLEQAKRVLRGQAAPKLALVPQVDPARARFLLEKYWSTHPDDAPRTLAARKGSGMTDEIAIEMFQSLIELGELDLDGEHE